MGGDDLFAPGGAVGQAKRILRDAEPKLERERITPPEQ